MKKYLLIILCLLLVSCSAPPKEVELEVVETPPQELKEDMPELLDYRDQPVTFEKGSIEALELAETRAWTDDKEVVLKSGDDLGFGVVTDVTNRHTVTYDEEVGLIFDSASYTLDIKENEEHFVCVLHVQDGEYTLYPLLDDRGNFPLLCPMTGEYKTLMEKQSTLDIPNIKPVAVQPIAMKLDGTLAPMLLLQESEEMKDGYYEAHCYAESITVTYNEESRSHSGIIKSLNSSYVPRRLDPTLTQEEMAELRASVPYEGPRYWSDFSYGYNDLIPTDSLGEEIARSLTYAGKAYEFDRYIVDGQYSNEYKLAIALRYTELQDGLDQPGYNYHPELHPLMEAAGDWEISLVEHVEATAKWLFGPDTVLEHQNTSKWHWYEDLGVYTPPHMGGGLGNEAIILSYEDKGDHIEALAVYPMVTGYGTSYQTDDGTAINREELKAFAADGFSGDEFQKYRVTLKRADSGILYVESIVKA